MPWGFMHGLLTTCSKGESTGTVLYAKHAIAISINLSLFIYQHNHTITLVDDNYSFLDSFE